MFLFQNVVPFSLFIFSFPLTQSFRSQNLFAAKWEVCNRLPFIREESALGSRIGLTCIYWDRNNKKVPLRSKTSNIWCCCGCVVPLTLLLVCYTFCKLSGLGRNGNFINFLLLLFDIQLSSFQLF